MISTTWHKLVPMALLAFPGVALAGNADSGVCEVTPPSFDVFEDLGDVLHPVTVQNPGPHVTLCQNPPIVRISADFARAAIEVRIPLRDLDTRPLSAGEFAAEIREVDVPNPWAFGETKYRVEGTGNDSVLVVDLPDESSEAASAWLQVPGVVGVKLASGQNVFVTVSSEKILRDDTAPQRASIERNIAFRAERIADAKANAAAAQQTLDNPGTIATDSDDDIARLKDELAGLEAEKADSLAKNAARWSSMDNQSRVVGFSSLANDHEDDAALRDLAEEFRLRNNDWAYARNNVKSASDLLDALRDGDPTASFPEYEAALEAAEAAAASAESAFAAAGVAVESYVKDNGLMNDLYAAVDAFQPAGPRPLDHILAFHRNATRLLESLTRIQTQEKERALQYARDVLALTPERVSTLEKEIAEHQSRLDALATQPEIVEGNTQHGVSCPAG